MSEVKYAKYRIVQNRAGSFWKYKVEARAFWPLPFWFEEFECDFLHDAQGCIERLKTKSKVVHIE